MKILIMMTGGTISTTVDSNGHLFANGKKTVSLLADTLFNNGAYDITFDYSHPLDILSENMTFPRLSLLLEAFRNVKRDEYGAIVVAHGTDTLAYTSALLSLVLAGWWDKPVFLVSSDRTLTDPLANGHDNFRAACELALGGFGAGVYVPYRNSDGVIYLHNGAHLRQCANFSSDFYSEDMCPYQTAKPYTVKAKHPILDMDLKLVECVLRIDPYVGMNYSAYNIHDGVLGVLHGSFHSSTACVERHGESEPYSKRSLLYLVEKCRSRNVEVFLSPLPESMRSTSGLYSTTADLIRAGVKPIFGLTYETAYIKLNLAYALGYEGDELLHFIEREIAGELLKADQN